MRIVKWLLIVSGDGTKVTWTINADMGRNPVFVNR